MRLSKTCLARNPVDGVSLLPARDLHHIAVKQALIKDGWTITHDPLYIGYGDVDVYIDLAAERPIAAEKDGRKIAVEIKSFVGQSVVRDMEQAVGQYILYQGLLEETEQERILYLAVDDEVYKSIFQRVGFQLILNKNKIHILVVGISNEEIIQWID